MRSKISDNLSGFFFIDRRIIDKDLFNKIFYGSDYPDRSVTETLQKSLEFFESKNLTSKEVNKILFLNAKEFYGWDL